jgi:hypothetical protein
METETWLQRIWLKVERQGRLRLEASDDFQETLSHHRGSNPCDCPGASDGHIDRVWAFRLGTNRHHRSGDYGRGDNHSRSDASNGCTRHHHYDQTAFNLGLGAVWVR